MFRCAMLHVLQHALLRDVHDVPQIQVQTNNLRERGLRVCVSRQTGTGHLLSCARVYRQCVGLDDMLRVLAQCLSLFLEPVNLHTMTVCRLA